MAFTQRNIRSVFLETGLVPYDPDKVLERLLSRFRIPSPPPIEPLSSSLWQSTTPRNLQELAKQSAFFLDRTQSRLISSTIKKTYESMMKECQLIMHNVIILVEENTELRKLIRKRIEKRQQSRKYVGRGGVLTVKDVRAQGQVQSQGESFTQTAYLLGETPCTNNDSQDITQEEVLRTRAAPKCSICRSLLHNARKCPDRTVIPASGL